ncbi:phospholipase A1-IIgamma-like [Dendronephthya gigantea]|uniref:phospholipase A1-IIgamma-like n=1 Tax=Dendronephthya gigantea TaxID=151771 RepID=UPI00106CBF91|nr:phospholipase A1-IIgamma-like [Dendronephthya gigantea]
MFRHFFFIVALVVSATANTVSPINKIIRLAIGVSKAAYLPIEGGRYVQEGHIVGRIKNSILPWHDPNNEKVVCSFGGWSAKGYEKKETEIILFKNEKQKLAVFGFRGTEPTNVIDWKKNFDMDLAEANIGQTKFELHKGFKNRYLDISSWFEAKYEDIPQDYTIVITGHSLGGALATISAAYASGKTNRRPDAVVTFASPLVGDKKFHDYYGKMVGCDRTLRITAKGDILTKVPFNKSYTHVCNALEVNGNTNSWWNNLNPVKSHSLYSGYDNGLARKFSNVDEINFGCDKQL